MQSYTTDELAQLVGWPASRIRSLARDGLLGATREGRRYRFGFIETPGVELVFELARVEVSEAGDMGWTLAIGDITINQPEGPPGRDTVRDFHTWRRHADGSWKLVVDVWNSGVPAS